MNPLQFTRQNLVELEALDLHQLVQQAAVNLVRHRLLLGRCLLALQLTGHYRDYGCSSPIHYAIRVLGLNKKEATTCRRVAFRLEDLPLLTAAAESGHLGWAKLREIVSKASPETEALWLELAARYNATTIARLAAITPDGGLPGQAKPTEAECEELTLRLTPENRELVRLGLQSLSLELGRKVEFSEAIGLLFAERLQARPVTERDVEKMRARATAVVESHERRLAEPLAQAHKVAVELGLAHGPMRDEELFEATTAMTTEDCPEADAQLVCRAKPHWQPSNQLAFNPEARGLTPAQTECLKIRDCYCCQTPDCPNHLWLQAHHIRYYSADGPTVPKNLVFLCSACHRNVHEGYLRIEGEAPDDLTFEDGEGRKFED
ncbi:MAG: HNH endonuclease [Vulcanimicrobiota bacterium]